MMYPPTLESLTDSCKWCGSRNVQRVRIDDWVIHCYRCGCNSPLPETNNDKATEDK